MAKHAKTINIIQQAYEILSDYHPMTVRQVYYQLVSRLVIENKRSAYNAVCNALVDARKSGFIPWGWIEDRLRMPREVVMWEDLGSFIDQAKGWYSRDVWETQPCYVECWVEKEALARIFMDVLRPYGVTLNVGRGYDGWSSIYNASQRFGTGQGVKILYFGDFDPSGEQMFDSLKVRLAEVGCTPEFTRCALNMDDIERYNLPPCRTKETDTRQKKFVAEHGDIAVELDALPPAVLEDRIRREVEKRMDLAALSRVKALESIERQRLAELFTGEV